MWPTISTEDLHFWFIWVVANAVGMAVGVGIPQFLLRLNAGATNLIVMGAIIGLALGIAQMRPINWLWVVLSMVGWAVGWSLGLTLFPRTGSQAVFALIGVFAGTLTGSLQWFILRHRSPRAGWWVLASILGWAVGMFIGTGLGGALGWPLVGVISGSITGVVLRWVL